MKSKLPIKKELYVGYKYLIANGMIDSANQIEYLLNADLADLDAERPLRRISIRDFITFTKLKIIKKEGVFSVSYEGNLSVDWRFEDGISINIVFCCNKRLLLRVL